MFESLEACVRFELKTILFAQRPDEEAAAIVSYLESLEPIPSPYLQHGRLSRSARRGKLVFDKAGCGKCHRGPFLTTRQRRDVGTSWIGDHHHRFDIPSLREVWRTPPYLHHGRAETIQDVITRFNAKDRHGDTRDLSAQQIADLVSYVLSL